MSLLFSPHPFTKKSKLAAVAELVDSSVYDRDYYVLLVGAILLAIGAIFADSVPVLIASMIIAPLAYPILTLGLGIIAGDKRLIGRAVAILTVSCALALGLAIGITLAFGSERVSDTYISFAGNRDVAIIVALVAGAIAAYGLVRPKVASAITGVAIAVSLMPPLVATGIGLASRSNQMAVDAGVLFLLNVASILASSLVVFACFGLRSVYMAYKNDSTSDQRLPR